MKQQQQQRADQLEALLSSYASRYAPAYARSASSGGVDTEVHEMAMLARYLQTSPALQPLPAFAQRLEQKVRAHNIRHMQTKAARSRWHWLSGGGRVLRIQIVIAALLFCILLTGTSTLFAMAASVSNPNSPLYSVKVWEQQTQLALASSPQSRATIGLQIIHDRLNAVPSLTGTSHASAYQRALTEIKQQIDAVTDIINTLPTGSNRQNLSNKLTIEKTNARHTLYSVLPKLPFAEQLTTTTVLGQLGMPVPSIQSVQAVITARLPASQATITVTGTHLTSTMHLVVNNDVVANSCVLQQDSCIFTIPWHGKSPLKVIAISNADCTAAQTTNITSTYVDDETNGSGTNGQSKGSGTGGDNGNDNSSNSNKNNGGNGNDEHTPPPPHTTATPTNEGKIISTPTPHK